MWIFAGPSSETTFSYQKVKVPAAPESNHGGTTPMPVPHRPDRGIAREIVAATLATYIAVFAVTGLIYLFSLAP